MIVGYFNKFLWLLVLFGFLFLLSPVSASVVINEFQIDPSDSQWVELYNDGDSDEDISGYLIDDSGGSEKFIVPSGVVLLPKKCTTFQSGKFNFNLSSTDSARLIASDTIIDTYAYSKSPGAGKSFGRNVDGANNWIVFDLPTRDKFNASNEPCTYVPPSPTSSPTPTVVVSQSPTPTVQPIATTSSYLPGIYLWEFLANPPTGQKEWVEIYNSNKTDVNLNKWAIDDIDGGSTPQLLDFVLPALAFRQVLFGSSKLNNDGDTVRLLRPDLTIADFYTYENASKGGSFARNRDLNWYETENPTPNTDNKFTPIGGVPHKESILEIKKFPLGTKIELEAFVSAPPEVFYDDAFYVVDKTSGIKIVYFTKPSFVAKLGDLVRVSSSVEESYSEKYIKTSTYEVLKSGLQIPNPVEIETGYVNESNEGNLVKIKGNYKNADGDNFYLDDGSGQAKVYLKDSTGILKLKMVAGDLIEVQGIVSQYGFLKDKEPNFRLMPRFQGDIRNITEEQKLKGEILGEATELPVTGSSSSYVGLALVFMGLVLRVMLKFSDEVY